MISRLLPSLRSVVALGAAVILAGCASIERAALPSPELKAPDLVIFGDPPGQPVDHAPWDAFLSRYRAVDAAGVARVAYGAVSAEDRTALDRYLETLAAADPAAMTRDQQLAYWINLYNALTVQVVLDAYPVDSIRKIKDGPFSIGPWDRPVTTVAGRSLSLNDIEHRVIRPAFQEPRIHYALNCAAVGCPNLAASAWRAQDLEPRLAAAERAYVNDPRGVAVDAEGRVTVSKIFVWFREDFGSNEAAVLERLKQVADPTLRAALEKRGGIDGYAYDWALNDRAVPPS